MAAIVVIVCLHSIALFLLKFIKNMLPETRLVEIWIYTKECQNCRLFWIGSISLLEPALIFCF